MDPAKEKHDAKRAPQGPVYTVQAVTEAFIEEYSKPRKRSWREDERIFRANVNPVWGRRPITSITPADVDALLDGIAKRAPIMANRTLARSARHGLLRDC